MFTSSTKSLAGCFGLTFAAAALGAWASVDAAQFYGRLQTPQWAPPAAAFAPVWTVLYISIAVAAWRITRSGAPSARKRALAVWMVQLAFNALWSWLFFHFHLGAAAFIDIVALWCAVGVTFALFWRIDRAAGAMLIPYWLWVSFALCLNYSVWQANPALLS